MAQGGGGGGGETTEQLTTRIATITDNRDYASQLALLMGEISLTTRQGKDYLSTIDLESLNRNLLQIRLMSEISRYEGFDPKELIQKLLIKYDESKRIYQENPGAIRGVDTSIRIGENVHPFKFSNDEPFSSDMQMLCLIFITRGAVFKKIMEKSSEHLKSILAFLKVKYDINTQPRKPGTTIAAEIITIPRIAGSFPVITVNLFHKGFGRVIFDPKSLYNIELPRAIFSPMMSSMLPNQDNTPVAVFFAISVKTDDILHQTTTKTSLMVLYQYFLASYNSLATTKRMKVMCCSEWGIGRSALQNGSPTLIYSEIIMGLRDTAKLFIRSSRPTDTNLETVLDKI